MYFLYICAKIKVVRNMRLRNVKNKEEIMNQSTYLLKEATTYKGKWSKFFKNNNPIYIEIGIGKGKFIIENALNNPNINYIGIEKFDNVIVKSLQKIPEGLNNLVMIREDALNITDLFDHEIDHLYLNFSDPWPKKRHHLRRLSSSIFLEKYDEIFKNVQSIEMRTDNRELFEYSLVSFSKHNYIFEDISLDLHHDNPPSITTEYEDKFSEKGFPIFYVLCKKTPVQKSK